MTIICTECQCFEVGGMSVVKDGKEQWICLDCYRELYAKRNKDDEKWQAADIAYDRARGT